jgi:hypothetical protein
MTEDEKWEMAQIKLGGKLCCGCRDSNGHTMACTEIFKLVDKMCDYPGPTTVSNIVERLLSSNVFSANLRSNHGRLLGSLYGVNIYDIDI